VTPPKRKSATTGMEKKKGKNKDQQKKKANICEIR